MGWTDEGLTKSRNQLLEEVHRRGEQLRARRRNVGLAVAAPVLLLAFLVPAALGGDGGRPTTVAASSPPGQPSSSTSALPPPVLAAVPSTTVAESSPTTTIPPVPTTAVAPTTSVVRATTTTRGQAATEPAPSTTTTSTPPTTLDPSVAPGPTCNPPKFTTSAQTDQPSYRAGETVRATATWSNTSGATCWFRHGYWGNWVEDANGQAVTAKAWPPFDHGEWRPFAPGEPMARTWEWVAAGPPGRYRVVFDYEPFAEPTASFEIVAG